MGDSVVYCGSSATTTLEGSVRLLSGDGIAEVFLHGGWSPVCGMSSGAASVFCKALGFAGTVTRIETARSTKAPMLGDLSCSGSETSVLECNFESGEDVYCAPSEASLIRCA